jgi:hypothetical protein
VAALPEDICVVLSWMSFWQVDRLRFFQQRIDAKRAGLGERSIEDQNYSR